MSPPTFSPELCCVSAAKLASPKPKHPLRFRAAAMLQATRRLSGKLLREEGNRALETYAVPMVVVGRLYRLADDVGRERGGLKRRLAAQHRACEDRRIDVASSVAHLLKLRIEIVLHRRTVGHGASELVRREAYTGEDDILHLAATSNMAEETLVVVVIVCAALVDADTADGVALTVEVAVELLIGISDGGVVVLIVTCVGVSNVVHHLEVAVAIVVAAVHAGGQEVELLGVVNKVGRLPAFAIAWPFNSVVGGDGDFFGGHGQ